MKSKKTILMIANSDTAMNGFLALQECFENMKNIRCITVCHKRVHVENAIKRCDIPRERICVICFDSQKSRGAKRNQEDYQYKPDIMPVAVCKALLNVIKLVFGNLDGMGKAYRIIKETNPSVILLYADNRAEFEKYFIFWAKRKQIKTVVAPICFSSIEGVLDNPTNGFRLDAGSGLPLSAKIIRRLVPGQERIVGTERIFYKQPFSAIVDCIMRLSAPYPWVQGSLADIVCTSYQAEYEEIVRELGDGVKEKLFLTDSIEDDVIFQGYKNRDGIKRYLSDKYDVNTETVAIVAFSERNERISRDNDLYDKDIIVRSILKYYSNVFISLHPRSNVEENRFLEQHEGCSILDEPLRKVIAAADVIAYGDASSVGRWVELLGINHVTWTSYSMWEKWSADMTEKFQDRIGKMKKEQEAVSLNGETIKISSLEGNGKQDLQRPRFADLLLSLL